MDAAAQTPEELETMLEDALLTRDPDTLAALFEEDAVLFTGNASSARGGDQVVRLALATWEGDHTYVANPRVILQARDVALVVVKGGTNVVRRTNGAWRYAIVLQSLDRETEGAEHAPNVSTNPDTETPGRLR